MWSFLPTAVLFLALTVPIDCSRSASSIDAEGNTHLEIDAEGNTHHEIEIRIEALEKENAALKKVLELGCGPDEYVDPQTYACRKKVQSWAPPAGLCDGQPNVWTTASCLHALTGGNLMNIFPFIAGPDGVISLHEWDQRVSNDPPARRIFMTIASQERPDGQPRAWGDSDDANTIDADDWSTFVQGAMQAGGSDDGVMDQGEFADYVAAAVTSEALFDTVNGHGGGFFGFGAQDETLDFGEWAMGFFKVGGMDGSVSLHDLAQSIGLQPADVHKVFKFMEDVGDAVCDKGWMASFNFESNAQDEARIDNCEWNQVIEHLKQFPGVSAWGGISKGKFASSIARMIAQYYNPMSGGHPYHRQR